MIDHSYFIADQSILATGEPPILLSISVLFAIKAALNSARTDAGLTGQWTLSK